MADKLIYANSDVTLHLVQGKVSSQFGEFEVVEGYNLAAGETLSLDNLASYQKEAVEKGEIPGLELVSESEAKKRAENMEEVKRLLAAAPGTVDVRTMVQIGDDNSFSDHQLSDAERVANHAARAEAEAGEAGPKDQKVTVVGAEEVTAPANAGLETRDDAGDQVQGSGGAEAAASKGSSKKSDK
jgi:hypothetical protein